MLFPQSASTVGSCAIAPCEPRQVRKKAAVSRSFYVPQGCLIVFAAAGIHMILISQPGARLIGKSENGSGSSLFFYFTKSSVIIEKALSDF